MYVAPKMFFTQKRHHDKHIACHIYCLQPEFCLQPKIYQKKMVIDHKPHNKGEKTCCSHSRYDFYASAPSKISQPLLIFQKVFSLESTYISIYVCCSTVLQVRISAEKALSLKIWPRAKIVPHRPKLAAIIGFHL